jgi:hypothetical protein
MAADSALPAQAPTGIDASVPRQRGVSAPAKDVAQASHRVGRTGSDLRVRKRIGMPVAGVMLAAAASFIAARPAYAVNPDGSFELVAGTGKCAEVVPDVNGYGFYIAGNRIQQRTCDGAPQQQWFLQQVDDGAHGLKRYHIVNRMTLQCLDDMDGATNNRNPVQQWTCNPSSTTMMWSFWDSEPIGITIVNERAGKCLDVTDGSRQDGARLQIYNCFDTENIAQHYTLS